MFLLFLQEILGQTKIIDFSWTHKRTDFAGKINCPELRREKIKLRVTAEIFLEWKPGAINGLNIKKYINGNFGVFLEAREGEIPGSHCMRGPYTAVDFTCRNPLCFVLMI